MDGGLHMSSKSHTTTDHDEIRRWVEERGGKPAVVKGTADKRGRGVLRIDMPGGAGDETFEHIGWEEFFEAFEENDLALILQDETAEGKTSRFAKFVSRNTAGAKK